VKGRHISITVTKFGVNPLVLPSLGIQVKNSPFPASVVTQFSHITSSTSIAQGETESQSWISEAQGDTENEAPGNTFSVLSTGTSS
jgi:hypothetical protein